MIWYVFILVKYSNIVAELNPSPPRSEVKYRAETDILAIL